MSFPAAVWSSLLIFGIGFEVYQLHLKNHKGTLTQTTQRLVLKHGPVVRQVTWAAWLGFSFWFAWHIWGH